jgi:phospholipase D3/4
MTGAPAAAYLVESIPQGLEDLRGTPGVRYTEDVLVDLTNKAEHSIDLTAMYWALLADPTSDDEKGFTRTELNGMGAKTGKALFDALHAAAGRGVHIRILEAPGFASGDKKAGTPPPEQESKRLRKAFPRKVEIHQITMGDWYGGSGIMHQKVWVFDRRHIYIGSANMDWKSIMQVKEMGVAVEDSHALADDVRVYFESWWAFGAIKEPKSVEVFDPRARIDRRVPRWSTLNPEAAGQAEGPVPALDTTTFNHLTPLEQELNGEPGTIFVSGAPDEVRGRDRTLDGDGLVYTIDDARHSVCVSVMDFAPVSIYSRKPEHAPTGDPRNTPVWWPDLFGALLSAALTRRVWVRLLVSRWAHTSPLIEPYLRALRQAADAGRNDRYMTAGQLEIKQFTIPGWDSTDGPKRHYPGHTRVNHTKYIVTDRRANIGTSNMTWDYFSSTAGASFNADHPRLVSGLQAVFDRDWASPYAHRLM